jgi:hypothetical protein
LGFRAKCLGLHRNSVMPCAVDINDDLLAGF